MLIKGDNSEHYDIMHNKHKLRDVVYQNTTERISMKNTLRLNQAIHANLKIKLSGIIHGKLMCRS